MAGTEALTTGGAGLPVAVSSAEVLVGQILEGAVPRNMLPTVKEKVLAVVAATVFSGPIPPPEQFAQYDRVLPGAADRILSMAESQQLHSHNWERAALEHQARNSHLGLWLGFAALTLLVQGALLSVYLGYQALAGGFIGTAALGLIPAFINGRGLVNWTKTIQRTEPGTKPGTDPMPSPTQAQKRRNGKPKR
ncbi:DUF2335 domain-containing protein [uncultured Gammaproteobacteria bacterium]